VPVDDGAASHLEGKQLPNVTLTATSGEKINLQTLPGLVVYYFYPMTGRPGIPAPNDWSNIPGAKGCTPQSCHFRDLYSEIKNLQAQVFGISSQNTGYQLEAKERLELPFELISDTILALKNSLQFPTFEVEGIELYKRMTLIAQDGVISKVFYPVFPPEKNPEDVLAWLQSNT